MADPAGLAVRPASDADRAALHALRTDVFVGEQGVPPELEQDEWDALADHVVATDAAGVVVGTGRLIVRDRGVGIVQRMAVRRDARGRGIGAALLAALEERARDRALQVVELHAQAHAQPFYERAGYTAYGEPFREAGIEHVSMRKVL
ncbi:MAG: GNAT family N-acetyltransferase [Mycobacteriales bacterium]|nr:GNAT family N-acetyltransferase [Frankia sp.]